jgi:hypothetical protein
MDLSNQEIFLFHETENIYLPSQDPAIENRPE